jgi:hypothetical protein
MHLKIVKIRTILIRFRSNKLKFIRLTINRRLIGLVGCLDVLMRYPLYYSHELRITYSLCSDVGILSLDMCGVVVPPTSDTLFNAVNQRSTVHIAAKTCIVLARMLRIYTCWPHCWCVFLLLLDRLRSCIRCCWRQRLNHRLDRRSRS